ncbi:hypothetical protein AMS68_006151 [Peltaster fructicola]|uniref:Uncharacterized protein n=1 Tax=Peltaster fructicola TaxID=286661 RepID=A0A6H0Y0V2_9PEZI|nr:hypothetical protein AMS68_006151 [Peltaster fructicola]
MAQTRTQATRSMINATPHEQDLLSRLHLRIYDWPGPTPLGIDTVYHWHRTWKDEQDVREALVDHDEDLDDWFVKSGNAAAYSTTAPVFTLQYSIARSFIARAKRAYRRGTTWEDFEDNELAIDSMSQAREVQNPYLRAIHTKEAVDNDLRLKIFYRIRHRLCVEIWLQPYHEDRRPMSVTSDGHVLAPIPTSLAERTSSPTNAVLEMTPISRNVSVEPTVDSRTTQAAKPAKMPTGPLVLEMLFSEKQGLTAQAAMNS